MKRVARGSGDAGQRQRNCRRWKAGGRGAAAGGVARRRGMSGRRRRSRGRGARRRRPAVARSAHGRPASGQTDSGVLAARGGLREADRGALGRWREVAGSRQRRFRCAEAHGRSGGWAPGAASGGAGRRRRRGRTGGGGGRRTPAGAVRAREGRCRRPTVVVRARGVAAVAARARQMSSPLRETGRQKERRAWGSRAARDRARWRRRARPSRAPRPRADR